MPIIAGPTGPSHMTFAEAEGWANNSPVETTDDSALFLNANQPIDGYTPKQLLAHDANVPRENATTAQVTRAAALILARKIRRK